MKSEAQKGSVKFQADLQNGHDLSYADDIKYLRENEQCIERE